MQCSYFNFKQLSDSFVLILLFEEVERDDDFCNACYEANDKNANFGAARGLYIFVFISPVVQMIK